jgi:hypothetical protein
MQILDRLLNGQHTLIGILPQQMDQRRQRRGLARPDDAGHDDQPVAVADKALREVRRKAEPVERRDFVRDVSEAGTPLALSEIDARAKAGLPAAVGQRDGAVHVLGLFHQPP